MNSHQLVLKLLHTALLLTNSLIYVYIYTHIYKKHKFQCSFNNNVKRYILVEKQSKHKKFLFKIVHFACDS